MRGASRPSLTWQVSAVAAVVTLTTLLAALPASTAEAAPTIVPVGELLTRITEAGDLPRYDPGAPHANALPALDAVADRLGIDTSLIGLLTAADTSTSPSGHHVRFDATHEGLPVYGASAAVHYDRTGAPWLAGLHLPLALPDGPFPTTTPPAAGFHRLAAAAASPSGWSDHDGTTPGPFHIRTGPDAVWHHIDGALVPAYRAVVVPLVPSGPETSGFDVLVHPTAPHFDRATPRWFEATGSGRIFDPSPEVAAQDAGFADNPQGDETPEFAALIETRALPRLDEPRNGDYRLQGQWVSIETDWDTNDTTATFEYPRSDARFEDTMSYYHMDYAQSEMQRLGFMDNTEAQRVLGPDVGLFNAYWSFSDYIVFGYHAEGPNGYADAAEDGDVVVHEYGHAVQFDVLDVWNFTNEDTGLIAEGWADLFSALVLLPANDGYDPACLGDWFGNYLDDDPADATPYCFRRLDNTLTYPDVMNIGGHYAGQVLSGMAWNITQGAGRDVALSLFLEANHLVPQTGGDARDFAEAVFLATDSLYGGAHKELVAWSARTKVLDTQSVADYLGVPWVDVNGPRIDAVYPDVGYPGADVWVSGRKLGNNTTAAPVVHLGQTTIVADDWSPFGDWLQFKVPQVAEGHYTLSVERDDGLIIPYEPGYEIDDEPHLFFIWPDPGVPGEVVALEGQNLMGVENGTAPAITIGGVAAEVVEWTETYVRVTVPEVPYGLHNVSFVRDDGKTTTYGPYGVVDALEIHTIEPGNVAAGGTVTLTGVGFGAAPDGTDRMLHAYAWLWDGPPPYLITLDIEVLNETTLQLQVPQGIEGSYWGFSLARSDGRSAYDERLRINMADLAVTVISGPQEPFGVLLPNQFGGAPDWVLNITNVGTRTWEPGVAELWVEIQQQVPPYGRYARLSFHTETLAPGASISVELNVFPHMDRHLPIGTWQGYAYLYDQDWQEPFGPENEVAFSHTFGSPPPVP